MELRKSEKPVESGGQGQPASARPERSKRRFQIVKLEERIAPCGNKGTHHKCVCPTCA
jgi:hypothetical protein